MLLKEGKIRPDEYERARNVLEQLGEEQQRNRQEQQQQQKATAAAAAAAAAAERGGSGGGGVSQTDAAMRRARAAKIEAETMLRSLGEQLARGEVTAQQFATRKANTMAMLEAETARLGRVLSEAKASEGGNVVGGADADANPGREDDNAEMLRRAGEARRAAAELAQSTYAKVRKSD